MVSQVATTAVQIRRAEPADADACGRICYEAFATINRVHGFPPEIPAPEIAVGLLGMLFSHRGFHCVVAELNGRTVGSNCLDERSTIGGIGPVTVEPTVQNGRIGRTLMQSVIDRARERAMPGIRLLQSTFHGRSLALYTRLGFETREIMSVMHGPPMHWHVDGCAVRPAAAGDIDGCNRVCTMVHGHDRAGELRDAVAHGTALVVERHGRITGYASEFGYSGHAVAESNLDLQALIGSADIINGPGLIVPTRNTDLFRWCLDHNWRVVLPLTLMSTGLYAEPRGAYLPSILY